MGHQIVVYLILSFIFTCSCSSTYGPFKLLINKFDVCAGPRNRNCTILSLKEMDSEGASMNVNFKVLENVSPTKGKILAMSEGKQLVRLQMNKPCEHLFLRPLLENMFSVSKSCKVLKGDYQVKLNMQEMAANYFGGSFFYGNISFRSVFYGSDCNFACTHMSLTLSPKK